MILGPQLKIDFKSALLILSQFLSVYSPGQVISVFVLSIFSVIFS